jgi:CDP-glucose 4,6-dehydratase
VRDGAAIRRAVEQFRPEVVLHLAAQALVRVSYAAPRETWETNVVGTAALLDALRGQPSVRAVVVVTSDKCYANRGLARGYREDDPLGGRDPYSASKAAQELVAASYRASFFHDGPLLATVRAGNVIGGGDWARDRLIPDVVAALLDGAPVVLRYPDAIRPWQHVLEPLHAYLVVAERLLAGDVGVAAAYNVGPVAEDHRSVAEVVDRMYAAWGREPAWTRADAVHAEEAPVLRLDASKAARELGVVPRFGLDAACRRTADWYRAWSSGAEPRALCDADLDAFEELA